MKKYLYISGICFIIGLLGGWVFKQTVVPSVRGPLGAVSFNSTTQATSSVGIYSWATVLSADSSRRYVTVCNDSISSNDAVYLGFGATTTKPYGYRLPSGSCYEMNGDKLFYGNLYAIASTATATVLTVRNSGN